MVIINQLNEEIAIRREARRNSPTGTAGIRNGISDNSLGVRDQMISIGTLIDIAQGDAGVQGAVQPDALSRPLTPPLRPVHDRCRPNGLCYSMDPGQVTILGRWRRRSRIMASRVTLLAVCSKIQTFNTNSNAFDMSQGGLFAARFWNEISDRMARRAPRRPALDRGCRRRMPGEVAAAGRTTRNELWRTRGDQ